MKSQNDGLTVQEKKVMRALITATNEFKKLKKQHPCDENEFVNGIHKCQQIIGLRILRRNYKGWYKIQKGGDRMNANEFAVEIAKKEGGATEANIAQIKEQLRITRETLLPAGVDIYKVAAMLPKAK